MIDLLIIVILIFVVFGLFVLLPLFIKFLDRKDKRLKFLLLIPVIFLIYSIYSAIYPPDSFYKHDFKTVTGINFPEQGEIIYKTASFTDMSGDYGSVSIIRVDHEFYNSLDKQLMTKGLTKTKLKRGSSELYEALKEIKGRTIEEEFDLEQLGRYYYVGFLSDKETLIVYRQSW
jgi:hypothetical protein